MTTVAPVADPARDRHYTRAVQGFEPRVRELIAEYGHHTICDIGGGRTPLLWPREVEELGVDYTLLDISAEELALGPPGHHRLQMDVCGPFSPANAEKFDLVFSKFVAEHVPDGEAMHRNIFAMLRPGGHAFHLFPTLWHPAFVLNRVLPHRLMGRVRDLLAGESYPKFPAVYSRCFGPSPRRVAALEAIGYTVEEYTGFYGTPYLRRVPLVNRADAALTERLARRGSRHLTSYAYLLLRKPA